MANNLIEDLDEAGSPTFEFKQHARYIGRMDWRDPLGPILTWAGSSIKVRFQGTGIALRLIAKERDECWMDLIIDDSEPRKVHINSTNEYIQAAIGFKNGIHTLEVYKRTEAMFGTVQLLGFELPDGGQFLPAPPHLERRIEIIGDSISVGSGNEGKNGDPNIAEHENNTLAYGTLAAQALQAEHHTIAVSGIGLVANYRDERVNTMPDQYGRLNALHDDEQWDFTQWIPDIVVINLGTNDSNYSIKETEFVDIYTKLVKRIRSYYPYAHIIMTLGPFSDSAIKDHIHKAFTNLREAGDTKVHYFLFDQHNEERDGMGETGHPNTVTHVHMAEQLVREIKQKVGWAS
jgi:lysophospholipase L1-like esterase